MRQSPIAPPPALTDGVISLRRRVSRDVPLIFDASEDSETRRWLDEVVPRSVDVEASLQRAAAAFEAGAAAPLTIADAASDDALGLVNLQFVDDDLATLAYSVFPRSRGRGVAARAVSLVCTWAFGDLGLTEVRLEIDPANLASVRVAEKLRWTLLADRTDGGKAIYASRAADPGACG